MARISFDANTNEVYEDTCPLFSCGIKVESQINLCMF